MFTFLVSGGWDLGWGILGRGSDDDDDGFGSLLLVSRVFGTLCGLDEGEGGFFFFSYQWGDWKSGVSKCRLDSFSFFSFKPLLVHKIRTQLCFFKPQTSKPQIMPPLQLPRQQQQQQQQQHPSNFNAHPLMHIPNPPLFIHQPNLPSPAPFAMRM